MVCSGYAFWLGGVLNNLEGGVFEVRGVEWLWGDTGGGTINNLGQFIKTGSGTTRVDGYDWVKFNNRETVDILGGQLQFREKTSYSQYDGTTNLAGGAILSSTPLDIQGGVVIGQGRIDSQLVLGGTLVPGSTGEASVATIYVVGGYDQRSTGLLDVEIGGTTAGSQYDQLSVGGTVALSGGLNVSVINDFVASVGDQFTIVANDGTDAITGEFDGLPEGTRFTLGFNEFRISYVGGSNANDVVLTVSDATAIYVPDLTLSSSDISFSSVNPMTDEPLTISARIVNQGLAKASDVLVRFFVFDSAIGEATVPEPASWHFDRRVGDYIVCRCWLQAH